MLCEKKLSFWELHRDSFPPNYSMEIVDRYRSFSNLFCEVEIVRASEKISFWKKIQMWNVKKSLFLKNFEDIYVIS